MTRRRVTVLGLVLYLVLALIRMMVPAASVVELGRWHLLVIESDDWGLEAWFPDREAARALADLVPTRPEWLGIYGRSSLETAAEVDSLRALLLGHRDLDGLPPVVQANHIVAAIDLEGCDPSTESFDDLPFALRDPGTCGVYRRPRRREAIDRARAAGVWRAELHGLTHFDLRALRAAVGDSLQRRAARHGTVAFPGWLTRGELGSDDAAWEEQLVAEAVRRFTRRFGRRPRSVIAPDYSWNHLDEEAWRRHGIEVVQGKREQTDPAHPALGWKRRIRKVLARWRDQRRGSLVYLDRNAQLEPYGNPDLKGRQCADRAIEQIRSAWAQGRPAILEMHRVQVSHLDEKVSNAGRFQLDQVLRRLEIEDGVRYCVDVEVAQLMRRGWSVVQRGPWIIVRNYTGRPLVLDPTPFRAKPLGPGTHLFPARRSEGSLSQHGYS